MGTGIKASKKVHNEDADDDNSWQQAGNSEVEQEEIDIEAAEVEVDDNYVKPNTNKKKARHHGGNKRRYWKVVRDEVEEAKKQRKQGSKKTITQHLLKADVSQVVSTVKDYLNKPSNALDNSIGKRRPSIHRVPEYMRLENVNAYLPKLVSIGPLHRNQTHLQSMQQHKHRFLARLLSSSSSSPLSSPTSIYDLVVLVVGNLVTSSPQSIAGTSSTSPQTHRRYWGDDDIETLVGAMKNLEKKARDSYAEGFSDIESNDFVLMMILDGCFIIQLLLLFTLSDKEYVDDPLFTTRWMMPVLQRDLQMLENQLPYFVLEKLFQLTVLSKSTHTSTTGTTTSSLSLAHLILNFFDPLLPRQQEILEKRIEFLTNDGKYQFHHHMLGLFRSTFLSSIIKKKPSPRNQPQVQHDRGEQKEVHHIPPPADKLVMIHCATELQEAGVKFDKRIGYDLLDVDFHKGRLRIPHLLVDDSTIPVFLNFMAYEQCVEKARSYFTHYVLFFDSLVNSSKDVEILHYRGVMSHVLGSDEEVANLLNNLCRQVVFDVDDCYLADVLERVNKYYEKRWHKWGAQFHHEYLRNPWTSISVAAAAILLVLTVIQTVFSILSYIKQS
ncbi:hypothetical protein Sjap_018745 [Stephania japonica]|uniref:Uncharacterized protein n=1 Tax=Stephania japonica TaxID=461633 RepID=A0AAP0I8P4_9MAGN